MNKLIIASLFLYIFGAKAPLPFEDEVKACLDCNCGPLGIIETELGQAFRNEMRYLLGKLKKNQDRQNDFIMEIITYYYQTGIIFPTIDINPNTLEIAKRGVKKTIEEIPEDKPGRNNNLKIKQWIELLYDIRERKNIVDLFINDAQYFALQSTFFILESRMFKAEAKKWASNIFAISYLRSFVDMSKEETEKQMHKIIEAFNLRKL